MQTDSTEALAAPAPVRIAAINWAGAGARIHVADLTINNPLVYVTDSRKGIRCEEPAAIDLALKIASQAYHPTERELGYWPRYDTLSAGQRRNYLAWLVSGRDHIAAELGYTFLFIYGLERRALMEQTDRRLVFDEVLRLRSLYFQHESVSRSFDLYTSSFLWFLVGKYPDVFEPARVQRLIQSSSLGDDASSIALGWFAAREVALPDWVAIIVAEQLKNSQRSIVTNRAGEEFKRLFRKRYRDRFGAGLVLKRNAQPRRIRYKPASAALSTMEANAPSASMRGLGVLSEIWNECIDELRKLSSLRGKAAADPTMTVAGWQALPTELRTGIDHPATDAVYRAINAATDEHGTTILAPTILASAAGISHQGWLTPAQGRKLCETLGDIGYCLEPDSRLTSKGYDANDRAVVLLRTSDQLPDSGRYNAAACMLRIGLAIANADNDVHRDELSILTQQIDVAFELTDDERRRLDALRTLLTQEVPEVGSFRKAVKYVPPAKRAAVGKLALALVAADGVITDDELKSVRYCFNALGLEPAEIDAALEPLLAAAEEPVTVQQAVAGSDVGETIPLKSFKEWSTTEQSPSPAMSGARAAPPPRAAGGSRLNRAAIASIMKDTQEVAAMLAEAMQVQAMDEDSVQSPSAAPAPGQPDAAVIAAMAAPTVTATSDTTLPQRYAAFYQVLIAKADWTVKEADATAREHGHMLAGAVEALNDWAFEKYGGQLFVEDGDRLLVERALLN